MADLAGKVALVTGGTKGIGKATALLLLQRGASVAINYSSDSASAEALLKETGPDRAFAIQADAGSIAGAEQMVKATIERFGKIDILVLNAGILPLRNISNTTEEDFDHIYNVNVKGPYFLAQKASKNMAPGSHIVFLSTTVCHTSTVAPDYLLYCTTKGAIEQLTKVLSKDLARREISVNAVAPGPTATELFLKGKSEQMLKAVASAIPSNRLGQPEEVAEAIVYLCSPASRWISGQILGANGGMASI